jgi:hypothetical protein
LVIQSDGVFDVFAVANDRLATIGDNRCFDGGVDQLGAARVAVT